MNKKVIRNLEKHTKHLGKIGLTITNLLEHDNIYYYEINIKDINVLSKIDDLDIISNDKHTLMLYSILKYLSKKYNDNTIIIDDDYFEELLGITTGTLIDIKNDIVEIGVVKISNDSYEILDNVEFKNDYEFYKISEHYYVYRFKNSDDEIIYVGRTTNLHNRMKQHFGNNSHLPKQCYDETYKVEYVTLTSEVLMVMAEIYFINSFSPKYNTKDLFRGTAYISEFEELKWENYNK